MPIYTCRDLIINTDERQIHKKGVPVIIDPRTFDVLLYLMSNAGKVCSKDQILGNVWEGTFVEEGNVPLHVLKIRRALGDEKPERLIETVFGIGYRFLGILEETARKSGISADNRVMILPFDPVSRDKTIRGRLLKFSAEVTRFFADVKRIDVIANEVVSRRLKSRKDAFEIAAEMNVAYVITGRYEMIDNRGHLWVEMIRTADLGLAWGHDYSFAGNSIERIRDELCFDILERLQTELNLGEYDVYTPELPEALVLQSKGKYMMRGREYDQLTNAINFLEESRGISSEARAVHLDLIESVVLSHGFGFVPRMEAVTRVATTVDFYRNNFIITDEFYVALAGDSIFCRVDLDRAFSFLLRAFQKNPTNILTLRRLADLSLCFGKFDLAALLAYRMLQHDPESYSTLSFVCRTFYRAGEFEVARTHIEKALTIEPESYAGWTILAACLIELGEYGEAEELLHKSLKIHPHPETEYFLAYSRAHSGDREGTLRCLAEIEKSVPPEHSIYAARVFAGLGDADAAMLHIRRALEIGHHELRALISDPRWVRISDDPRFRRLVSELRLDDPPPGLNELLFDGNW